MADCGFPGEGAAYPTRKAAIAINTLAGRVIAPKWLALGRAVNASWPQSGLKQSGAAFDGDR